MSLSDSPDQKSDAAARAPVPEWLFRIERDETRALLRASSEFARVGYAPFLEKAKDSMGNIIKDASGQPKKINGDPSGFKNHFLGGVPATYLNGVTGRRLGTDPPKSSVPGVRPASPRVSQEMVLGSVRAEELKKIRNDPDAIVDRVLGVKTLQATYEKKDPISDIQIQHMRPLEDQLVELPSRRGGGGRTGGAGGVAALEGVTAQDLVDAEGRRKVPNPSEVLRRYKTFSTEPEHPTEADAVNLLNPDAGTTGKTAPKHSAGSALTADFQKAQSQGSFISYAPSAASRPSGGGSGTGTGTGTGTATSTSGTLGARSLALQQNRMGSTQGMSGAPVRRGGSGLVVGVVSVLHDYLIPASLVIAKWGRLVSTQYGVREGEPNTLAVEVQPLYLESLEKDLESATGGRAIFTGSGGGGGGRPQVFLLDIGTVNSAIHGHRPSGAPPEALELQTSGSSYSVAVGAGTNVGGGGGGGESSEEEYTETLPGVNGAPPTTIVRRRRKRKLFRLGMADAVTALMTGKEIVEDETRARRRAKPPREMAPMTEEDMKRAELKIAVENAKARANKQLFELARAGEGGLINTLLTKGYRVSYEPNSMFQVQGELGELSALNKVRGAKGERPFLSLEEYRDYKDRLARRRRMKALAAGDVSGGEGEGEGEREGGGGGGPGSSSSSPSSQMLGGGLFKRKAEVQVPDIDILPDINIRNSAGNTPLIEAARRGNSEAVAVLLKHGANADIRNLANQKALDLAKVENGFAGMALAAGLPGAPNRKRQAAKCLALLDDRSVMVAARDGDMRRLNHLVLREKHDVGVCNEYGMTPLHFAVMRSDVAMVKFLCGEGASVNAENNLKQSPWTLAQAEPKKELRDRLLKAMQEGHERLAKEAERQKVVEETARRRAKQEAYLVRELKTMTKGTAAARAVQLALSSDGSDNAYTKLKNVPSLGLDLTNAPRSKDVQGALNASMRGGGGGGGSSGGGGSGGGSGGSAFSSTLTHHAPKDLSIGVLPRGISQADKLAASHDLTQLSTVWSRHVLNFLAHEKTRAKTLDAFETRRLGEAVDRQNKERKRLGLTGGGRGVLEPVLERTGPLNARQQAADQEYRAALAAPDMVDEDKLRNLPVPDPDSRRFESWVRMRGLS